MYQRNSSDRIPDALVRATRHWETRHEAGLSTDAPQTPRFTIAVSRETGSQGTALARAIGERLGWVVYDHELVERIAQDMQVRASLLDSVDERRVSWLQECLEAFAALRTV